MPGRTDSTPLLTREGRAVALTRIVFQEWQFDEELLQQLLF